MISREILPPAPGARPFDVLAIGHAIVDVVCHSDDQFLVDNRLSKGHMQLVDLDRSTALYKALGPSTEVSGGSGANSVAGIASFGGSAAFVGTVSDDQLGQVFIHDIRAAGVEFPVEPISSELETGRSIIIISPDSERTMNTYLGSAGELDEQHINDELFAKSSVVFLEGYMFDIAWGERLFKWIVSKARDAGCQIAFTLSDPFVINRYRSHIENAIADDVDILFTNDDELQTLYPGVPFEDAVTAIKKQCSYVAVTRGAAGSLVSDHGDVSAVQAAPTNVVDLTGAGDAYAAGFLFGYTRAQTIQRCGELGSIAAAEVIAHLGARPSSRLSDSI